MATILLDRETLQSIGYYADCPYMDNQPDTEEDDDEYDEYSSADDYAKAYDDQEVI